MTALTLLSVYANTIHAELQTIKLHRSSNYPSTTSHNRHLFDFSTATLNGCEFEPFTVPITINHTQYNAVFNINEANTILTTSSCTTCHVTNIFTPNTPAVTISKSINYNSGTFSGSLVGNTYSESVELAGLSATVNLLAVNTDNSNLFDGTSLCNNNKYDGVIGFNGGSSGSWLNTYENGSPIIFAHTFCPNSGELTINGFDAFATNGANMVTAQLNNISTNGYTLNISEYSVGNSNSVQLNSNTFIIDTTLTQLMLFSDSYTTLTNSIQSATSNLLGTSFFDSTNSYTAQMNCVSLNESQLSSLPTLSLTVQADTANSFDLILRAYPGYLINSSTAAGEYCNNLLPSTNNINRVGYGVLSQYVTVYNLQKSTVGFVPTKSNSCTSSGSLSGSGTSSGSGSSSSGTLASTPTTIQTPNPNQVSYNLSNSTLPSTATISTSPIISVYVMLVSLSVLIWL